MKSRERIESAIHDLRNKTGEYEEVGSKLLQVAGELEVAAEGVIEQTRSTTRLIAGEFKEDFGLKSGFGEGFGREKREHSQIGREGDEFDRWVSSHKEEVKRMVCGNPEYEKAVFCQMH